VIVLLDLQERDLNPLARILRQPVQPTADVHSRSLTSLLFEVQVTLQVLRNPIVALLAKALLIGGYLDYSWVSIYQKFNCCYTMA